MIDKEERELLTLILAALSTLVSTLQYIESRKQGAKEPPETRQAKTVGSGGGNPLPFPLFYHIGKMIKNRRWMFAAVGVICIFALVKWDINTLIAALNGFGGGIVFAGILSEVKRNGK